MTDNTTNNVTKNNFLRIRVKVTEIKTETNTFNAYKALGKNKKWVDLRFTKDVTNLPKEDCYIIVHTDNINYTENYLYPRFWVREIEEIVPIETRTTQDATEFFEDIPFNK